SHLRSMIFCRSDRPRPIDTWRTSAQTPPRLPWIFGSERARRRWRDRTKPQRGRHRGSSSGAGTPHHPGQPNSLEVVGGVLQHRQQRFRFARHLYFPNDLARVIHNADARLLDRNVQSSKMVHAALLLLMLEAVFTDLVSPSA